MITKFGTKLPLNGRRYLLIVSLLDHIIIEFTLNLIHFVILNGPQNSWSFGGLRHTQSVLEVVIIN